MSITVEIKKNLGDFRLDVAFHSDSRRIGILGASGCGKSLTLKSIAGIEQPDTGRIVLNGQVLFDGSKRISLKPQVRRVGYLFQNYALFPTMTVEQNIAAGLTGKKPEKKRRVRQMMERFQLQGLEMRFPSQLSGGQQQRVALARILAYEPAAILLDEPFSALDVYLRDQMQRELMEMLKEYPGIIILVSHNRDEVYRMSDELLVLDSGKLAGQGRTKKLFEDPGNVVTARLTGCKNITDVERLPEGTLYAAGWKMELPLQKQPDCEVRAAAIRAHQFSMRKDADNERLCFPVLHPVITEDLFEYNISFQTAEDAAKRMDWKISKYIWNCARDGLPDRLYLKESDLLLLK